MDRLRYFCVLEFYILVEMRGRNEAKRKTKATRDICATVLNDAKANVLKTVIR